MAPIGRTAYKTTKHYGATVSVFVRGRGMLYLRYTSEGKPVDKSLNHRDLTRAKEQARELSKQLQIVRASESNAPGARSRLTIAELMAHYKLEVSAHKKGQQPNEDERRRIIWTAFLKPQTLAKSIKASDVERFIAHRRKGLIVIPGIALRKKVKPATIDGDVVFLQSVFNWGVRADLLKFSPIKDSKRPDVAEQLRPMAEVERFDLVFAHAPKVHALFPLFFMAVRTLGWRVSAICQLIPEDFERTTSTLAPYGSVRKRWDTDKEGVHEWLPMPQSLRAELDRAGIIGKRWVFPAVKNTDRCWSRSYPRDLLERAEAFANVKAIEGGDWHPYRRLWATERKALPVPDVANAGGWKDHRTVQKYQQRDPATTSAVMLFTPTIPSETWAQTRAPGRKRRAKGA